MRTTSLDDYVYTIPQGWTRTAYPDGIVYGSQLFRGNTITLTADGDRANPKHGWIRLEQDSKDGATWTDRLCLLLEGIGDVCYARDQGP